MHTGKRKMVLPFDRERSETSEEWFKPTGELYRR
ncbi:hypothetical protein AT864_03418 [Anoxybacillus sp. P3H1B]|nr:hypothetical protein AT864_03418 [Anoxybacillus sp. P3H1B]